MRRQMLAIGLAALGTAAAAEVPQVAADIAPVHSLAARVMEGLGEPALILPPDASPHDHAMRPSEAAALQEAELVLWLGDALTPWLGHAIGRLAEGARVLPLLEVEGTTLLPFREGALFGEGAHDHGHGGLEEEHGHGEGETDPHAWLDPDNAALWLDAIAETLAALDPENADAYRANAREGRSEIEAAAAEAERRLASARGRALPRAARRLPLLRGPLRDPRAGGDLGWRRGRAGPRAARSPARLAWPKRTWPAS